MKTSPKGQKVATILKQKIPKVLQQMTDPQHFGFISIVDIHVSIDQKYADIFVQSIKAPKGFLKKLNAMAPKIAHEVVQTMPQRKKIELRFKKDESSIIFEKLNQDL